MEISALLIGFGIVWVLVSVMLSAAWAGESPTDDYPMEFLWWPIWLLTVGLMRVFKSMKRAISDEWKKS